MTSNEAPASPDQSGVCCFTAACEIEGVKEHLSCSHTDTEQENTDTDIQSTLIAHILTDRRDNILTVRSSTADILVSSC